MIEFIVGFSMIVAIVVAIFIDDKKTSDELYEMYKDLFDEYNKIN